MVKQFIQSFEGGMNKDASINERKNNVSLHAENLRFFKNNNNKDFSLININGTVNVDNLSKLYPDLLFIGSKSIGYDKAILFLFNDTTKDTYIYMYDTSITGWFELYYKGQLDHTKDSLITCEYRLDSESRELIYFSDGDTPMRVMNLLNKSTYQNIGTNPLTFKDPSTLDYILDLYTAGNAPKIDTQVNTSGSLYSGVYQYAYQLVNKDGIFSKISPWSFRECVGLEDRGGDYNVNCNKSISIKISGITVPYYKIKVYCLFYDTYNTPKVFLIDEQITGGTSYINTIHSSNSDILQELTINDVNNLHNTTYAFKALCQKNNYLIGGNVKELSFNSTEVDNYDARAYRFASGISPKSLIFTEILPNYEITPTKTEARGSIISTPSSYLINIDDTIAYQDGSILRIKVFLLNPFVNQTTGLIEYTEVQLSNNEYVFKTTPSEANHIQLVVGDQPATSLNAFNLINPIFGNDFDITFGTDQIYFEHSNSNFLNIRLESVNILTTFADIEESEVIIGTSTVVVEASYNGDNIIMNSDGSWASSLGQAGTSWDLPIDSNRINLYNDIYNHYISYSNLNINISSNDPNNNDKYIGSDFIYQKDGVTVGGSGLNINYEIKPLIKRLLKNAPTSKIEKLELDQVIADDEYYLNISTYEDIDYTNEGTIRSSLNQPLVINQKLNKKLIECKNGEVYRVGIQFVNKKGQWSFVKHIDDIRFPSEYTEEFLQSQYIGEQSFSPQYQFNALSSILEVNVTNLSSDVIGYRIVRTELTQADKTIVARGEAISAAYTGPNATSGPNGVCHWGDTYINCLTTHVSSNGDDQNIPSKILREPDLSVLTNNRDASWNPTGDLPDGNSGNGQWRYAYYKTRPVENDLLVTFDSPDLLYNNSKLDENNLYLIVSGTYNKLIETSLIQIGFDTITTNSKPNVYQSFKLNKFKFIKSVKNIIKCSPEYTNGGILPAKFIGNLKYSNTIPECTLDYNAIFEAGGIVRISDNLRIGAKNSTHVIQLYGELQGDEFIECDNASSQYSPIGSSVRFSGGYTTTSAIASGILIRDNFISKYGGSSYTDILQSKYIPFSDIHFSNGAEYCVYGDSYSNYHSFLKSYLYDYPDGDYEGQQYYCSFPVQSNINIPFKLDNYEQYISGGQYASSVYPQESQSRGIEFQPNVYPDDLKDLYRYNTVYSQQNNSAYFYSKPLDFNAEKHIPNKIMASNKKFYGESLDSWTIFGNSFIEVNTNYGEVNGLVDFNDNLLFIQDNAFGTLPVEQSALIPSASGALQTGVSGVLTFAKYHSTSIGAGCLNEYVATIQGVFLIHRASKGFYNISRDLQPINVNGMNTFFFTHINNISSIKLGNDNAYNEIYISIGNQDTLVYDKDYNVFTSYHTFVPEGLISLPNRLYSFKNGTLFSHNSGLKNVFYGEFAESNIQLRLCNEALNTKTFYNLQLDTLVSKNLIELLEETVTSIDYQNGYLGKISVICNTDADDEINMNMTRIARTWSTKVPLSDESRFVDKYLDVTFHFNNEDVTDISNNKAIEIRNLIVSYN